MLAIADFIIKTMETKEIWKSVSGYEGLYEISSYGRVKSFSRIVSNGNGHRKTNERILKGLFIGAGYYRVCLCNEGVIKSRYIHMLVACTFLNYIPGDRKIVIDHINGAKTDNRVENIRIVTNRFNCTLGERKNKNKLTSQYEGVCWDRAANRWRSIMRINGKQKHLGYFKNELDAANAYRNKLKKLSL